MKTRKDQFAFGFYVQCNNEHSKLLKLKNEDKKLPKLSHPKCGSKTSNSYEHAKLFKLKNGDEKRSNCIWILCPMQ